VVGSSLLEDEQNLLAESNKLHYSYCNDKGNLAMVEVNNPDIQPRLRTVILDLQTEATTQGITIFKAGPNDGFVNKLTNSQTLAFLAPKDYYLNRSAQYLAFSKQKENNAEPDKPKTGIPEEIALPEIFNQYPHLIHESTVQIFHLNKLIHTGFLNQFWLEEKGGGVNPDGRPLPKYVVLKFLNQVRANPQVYKTQNLIQQVISGLAEHFVGIKSLLGLQDEVPKEEPENEESTRRTYRNPNKSASKNKPLITPDLLYANTVDLKYDFFEFANRYCDPSLVFRFQYSMNLLNNLHNSNNKSHELNLDLKFNNLGVIINKVGEYQGDLKLKADTDNFMGEILEEDLTNPELKLTAPQNEVVYPISDASIAVGDETMTAHTFTHEIKYEADKREYAHATYFCFNNPDNTEQDLVNQRKFTNQHPAFKDHYRETGTTNSVSQDDLQEERQEDQAEEIPDLNELEENEGENEEGEPGAELGEELEESEAEEQVEEQEYSDEDEESEEDESEDEETESSEEEGSSSEEDYYSDEDSEDDTVSDDDDYSSEEE
ncbi:6563_t:CDS:2, partial [Racocetra persica]